MKFSRIIKTLFFAIWLVLPLLSQADDAASGLFAKGNDLYAKGKYSDALTVYQQIVNDGYRSAALYFNMGDASYKKGDIPSAILYFEKAHKLSPGDADINFNLKYAGLKTIDKVEESPEFFLSKWWKDIILSFSVNTLAAWSVILALLGSGVLILYFFAGSVGIKKTSFYTAILFFFCALLSIFVANRQLSYFDSHQQAIVFSGAVNVKSSPEAKAATLFVIHDGTKVNVLDQSNGWIRISLANGTEGWIKPSDIKEI